MNTNPPPVSGGGSVIEESAPVTKSPIYRET